MQTDVGSISKALTKFSSDRVLAKQKCPPGPPSVGPGTTSIQDAALAQEASIRPRSNAVSTLTDAEAEAAPKSFSFLTHAIGDTSNLVSILAVNSRKSRRINHLEC